LAGQISARAGLDKYPTEVINNSLFEFSRPNPAELTKSDRVSRNWTVSFSGNNPTSTGG